MNGNNGNHGWRFKKEPPADDQYHVNYSTNNLNHPQPTFAHPPLMTRPLLFCCPVAESNPEHLPRSFVNPGRHLMNTQLRTFLECADDPTRTFDRCEVSHMVEVTTRLINNPTPRPLGRGEQLQQWNVPGTSSQSAYTPPLDEADQSGMAIDKDGAGGTEIPFSSYHSMSTRAFITHPANPTWQQPPHSRTYREQHADHDHGRMRQPKNGREKYMEIPPFKSTPYTSEGTQGSSVTMHTRSWMPSCSIVMWCTVHNNFYEVHVLS